MTPDEYSLAKFFLEDNARLFAAGKVQRWEVVKWAVAFNLALSAAATAEAISAGFLLALATTITVAAGLLLAHFNEKMTRCRATIADVFDYLKEQGVDVDSAVRKPMPDRKGRWYDDRELGLFMLVVLLAWGAVLSTVALAARAP